MVEDIDDHPEIKSAMEKAKVDEFVEKLPEKEDTMLTRFFYGWNRAVRWTMAENRNRQGFYGE